MNASPELKHLTCPLCEAMCGLEMKVEGSRIQSIRGDPQDPLSRGAICPKAVALKDLHEDPDRLRHPLRRKAGSWERVTWKEAFRDISHQLRVIRKAHGKASSATYFGNPLVHNTGAIVYASLFSQALRTPRNFSATSLDQLPHMLAAYTMFGHQLLLPVPDVDRTDTMVIMGANPVVSNGSIMSAPGIKARLKKILARGGHITVIDPRRTETADLATEHLPIRPGTDALLLFAVARTLFEEHPSALGKRASFTVHLDRARRLAAPFRPEAVAGPTGISAEHIRALAALVLRPRSVLYGRLGVCTQAFGGLCGWLINLVNLIAGNLDEEGGAMFTTPAIDTLAVASLLGRTGSFRRRTSAVAPHLPEFGGELPTVTMAEEIEAGHIRTLITAAGNPVLSSPQGTRLDRALSKLDFMVSIDPYLNETTRHAHYILPPVSPLERDHYDLVFHALAVRNTARITFAAFKAPKDTKQDWEIFQALTRGLKPKRSLWLQSFLMGTLGPRRLLDLGLRVGPYRTNLRALAAQPSGLDFGPLESRLPGRLFRPDKTIDAAPEVYEADVRRLEAALDAAPPDLVLIGRRELRSNNSWMHNAPTLQKGRSRCTLRIHPVDAEARGLATGERARLSTSVGTVEVPIEVTDELRPGVVSLPHGYGHHRDGTQLSVAGPEPGVSVNDVLAPNLVDPLTGTARLNDQPVQVTPIESSSLEFAKSRLQSG